VTLADSLEVIAPIRVLLRSLEAVESQVESHVFLTSNIPEHEEKILEFEGFHVHRISNSTYESRGELKIQVLKNCVDFDAIGFLPSGAMFHNNADHAFLCTLNSNSFCITKYPDPMAFEHWDFDPEIFWVTPDDKLVEDISIFAKSNFYDKARQDLFNAYFYHYCKGNGYPISEEYGEYNAPELEFDCSDPVDCKLIKSVSSSPCYSLPQTLNFHPYDDELKKDARNQVSIVQFNGIKPWHWRNMYRDGWQAEWNAFGPFDPPLQHIAKLSLDEKFPHSHLIWLAVTCAFLCLGVNSARPIFRYLTCLPRMFKPFQRLIPSIAALYILISMSLPLYSVFIIENNLPEILPRSSAWWLALEVVFTETMTYLAFLFTFIYVLALISTISKKDVGLRIPWAWFMKKKPTRKFPFFNVFMWASMFCVCLYLSLGLLYLLRWLPGQETKIIMVTFIVVWVIFLLWRGTQVCADIFHAGLSPKKQKQLYGRYNV